MTSSATLMSKSGNTNPSMNGIPAAHCGLNAERDATTPAGKTFLPERLLLTLAHKGNFLAHFVNNVNSFSCAFTRQRALEYFLQTRVLTHNLATCGGWRQ